MPESCRFPERVTGMGLRILRILRILKILRILRILRTPATPRPPPPMPDFSEFSEFSEFPVRISGFRGGRSTYVDMPSRPEGEPDGFILLIYSWLAGP